MIWAKSAVQSGTSNRLSTEMLDLLAPLLESSSERSGWTHCVEIAQQILDADVVGAIEFLSHDRGTVRAAFGNPELAVGTIVPVAPGSQTAFVRDHPGVCVVDDLDSDTRFTPSAAFQRAGINSSMSMSFELPSGLRAIIGAHSVEYHRFDDQDVATFESLGAVFAASIRRLRHWDELELNARIDPLTGLMNRSSILRQLEIQFENDSPATAILIDLDGFKAVNDELGHRAGDLVLRTVSERIERAIGSSDALGRLGGDEFLLTTTESDGALMAERVLGHIEEVIMVESRVTQISASIGIARRRSGEDPVTLLERADRLMYQAKAAGRGEVRVDIADESVFNDEPVATTSPSPRHRRPTLELVDEAIDGLRIVVQPIVDARTHAVCGIETLARGPIGHPLEFPDRLFSAATTFERLGKVELEAKRLAFDLDLDSDVSLFVNLEPTLLCDEAWMSDLTNVWKHSRSRAMVTVEVTERSVLQSPGRLLHSVDVCRDLGWRIALDDVGSRSESLAALRWIDPDVVKLDMSLIRNHNPAHSAHVVAAIAAYRDMDRHGDVQVIAEGVETAQDAALADVLGADLLQGYLFGRPCPIEDLHMTDVEVTGRLASTPPRVNGKRVATKRELVSMTRHVEASVLSSACILVSAIQDVANVSTQTRRQYEGLARRCGFVGMVGTRLSTIEGSTLHGVRTADLDESDPMCRAWQVVAMSPTASIGLLATEVETLDGSESVDDLDRLFSYRFITDPGDVEAAARQLLRYF